MKEYDDDDYEYDDEIYVNTEPDDEEVIYNILRNRIPDYNANAMFGESHNFCDIGRYEDMPGEEEIANILNSMSRETLNKYFSNNPDDLMLFHMMRNKYSDIMPLVDEKYLEEYNKKMEDLGTSLTGMSDEEVVKKYEELLAERNVLLKAKKEGKELNITTLEENADFIDLLEGYGLSSEKLQKMLSEKKFEMDREQDDSKRKKFEKDLSREDVVEYFLSKTPEELEKEYGVEVARMVGFEQKNSHHCYDLWEHSLRTVEGISKENLTPEQFTKLRVAAFFHDIGKPEVAKMNEKTGQQVFYGHAYRSVDVAKPILEELGYSEEEIKQLGFYIAHHDDFISYRSSVPEEMKNHEFVREINVDSITEKIIENKYDFEKMEYNKDQVRAIVYTLAHGKEPEFKDFKGQKISIPIDMEEVKEKINSGEYNSEYDPTLEDYKMLLQICKADANAQAEKAERTLPDGKVVVDGTKQGKLENMSNIENSVPEAYEKVNNIVKSISQELKQKIKQVTGITFEEFISQTKDGFKRPRVVMGDGVSLNVQASSFHYCKPRRSGLDTYDSYEVGYPSEIIEELKEYAEIGIEKEEDYLKSIYPYVPKDVISKVIMEHGGIDKEATLKPKSKLQGYKEEKDSMQSKTDKAMELVNQLMAQLGNAIEDMNNGNRGGN